MHVSVELHFHWLSLLEKPKAPPSHTPRVPIVPSSSQTEALCSSLTTAPQHITAHTAPQRGARGYLAQDNHGILGFCVWLALLA